MRTLRTGVAFLALFALDTLRTGVAFFALRTLCTGVAFLALFALHTLSAGDPTHIHHPVIGEPQHQLPGIGQIHAGHADAVQPIFPILAVSAVFTVRTVPAIGTILPIFPHGVPQVEGRAVGQGQDQLPPVIKIRRREADRVALRQLRQPCRPVGFRAGVARLFRQRIRRLPPQRRQPFLHRAGIALRHRQLVGGQSVLHRRRRRHAAAPVDEQRCPRRQSDHQHDRQHRLADPFPCRFRFHTHLSSNRIIGTILPIILHIHFLFVKRK